MASTTTVTPSEAINKFNIACTRMNAPVPYSAHGTFYYVRRAIHSTRAKEIATIVKADYGCRECRDRFLFLACLFGENNMPVLDLAVFDTATIAILPDGMIDRLRMFSREFAGGEIVDIYVLSDNDTEYIGGFRTTSGTDSTGIDYHHYCAHALPTYRNIGGISPDYLSRAFNRYVMQGTVLRAFKDVRTQGQASLDVMRKILTDVTYGIRFLPALEWLEKLIAHVHGVPIETHLLDVLASGGISKDGDHDVVVPIFHTALQLIELLQCARDETAMFKIVEQRLSPLNYQRPTAPPSATAIAKASEIFNQFRVTVATLDALTGTTFPGFSDCVAIRFGTSDAHGSHDTLTAGDVLASMTPKHQACVSFADRCSISPDMGKISTVDALMNFIRDHPATRVELKSASLWPVYLALYDGVDAGMLCVPYMWSFGSKTVFSSQMELAGMVLTRTGTYNNIVLIPRMSKSTIHGGCFFPEFITTAHRRTCGSAFEALNASYSRLISVPSTGVLANGYGASQINASKSLGAPLPLRLSLGDKSVNVSIVSM